MSESDKAVLQVGAGIMARSSYASFRRELQEFIESAFLDGRDGNEFWFGILWNFDCPSCNQESNQLGRIRFRSKNAQEVQAYLMSQGATCINCGQTPPQGSRIHVRIFNAPLVAS
jgi:hypothetical protein